MLAYVTGKHNGFPILDILGYLKNTHKNPKFGRVRQIRIREFPTKCPNWDLSHSPKFGIFVGILMMGSWYSLNTLRYPKLGIRYFSSCAREGHDPKITHHSRLDFIIPVLVSWKRSDSLT